MRRSFKRRMVVLFCTLSLGSAAYASPRYKAVVFDYLVLFDGNSVIPAAERAFPGHGAELVGTWRAKQFEYGFLRSITGRQTDFFKVTADALVYAARSLKLELSPAASASLLGAYLNLQPWADALTTLKQLKGAGIRLIALSNFSPAMLRASAQSAGWTGLLEDMVSTEQNGSFKPEPRAYALAMKRLGLPKNQILFVSFGGWDAYGAKNFGFRTFWVNRFELPTEELSLAPDAMSTNLDGLLSYLLR